MAFTEAPRHAPVDRPIDSNVCSYYRDTMPAPIEFVESEAKSVLNRVEGMPFKWSINPYRGCSHACAFCLCGDTSILMADGTTRPLEETRIGDQIYGTVKRGNYRRYTRTFVLNHWSVEKPAHRVTLEDGTQLVASEDHRFLTGRGWKFVIGAEQGPMTRPHLTTNNKLMGTGKVCEASGPWTPLPHKPEAASRKSRESWVGQVPPRLTGSVDSSQGSSTRRVAIMTAFYASPTRIR